MQSSRVFRCRLWRVSPIVRQMPDDRKMLAGLQVLEQQLATIQQADRPRAFPRMPGAEPSQLPIQDVDISEGTVLLLTSDLLIPHR